MEEGRGLVLQTQFAKWNEMKAHKAFNSIQSCTKSWAIVNEMKAQGFNNKVPWYLILKFYSNSDHFFLTTKNKK